MQLSIDLGNCLTKACFISDNTFVNLKDPGTKNIFLSSSIHINPGNKITFGQQADDAFFHYLDPKRFTHNFKKNLGKRSRHAYLLNLSPEDQIVRMLKHLKDLAEEQFNAVSDAVVLTVPESYGNNQYDAMKHAAYTAGFHSVRLLKNSLAAMYYFDWYLPSAERLIPNQITLIYQLGGTFEAGLVSYNGSSYQCRSLYNPLPCGGLEFDRLLFEDIKLQSSSHLRNFLDIGNSSKDALLARFHVQRDCQDLKLRLCEHSNASVTIAIGSDTSSETYMLTRERFNALIMPSVKQSIAQCDYLLREANLTWDRIDRVLLVGGSCQIPCVKQEWQNILNTRVVALNDPLMAICAGGAIYGENAPPQSGPVILDTMLEIFETAKKVINLFVEDQNMTGAIMTYHEAISYFVTARPNDSRIVKGTMARLPHPKGKIFVQMFLDAQNNPVYYQNQPYGRRLLVQDFDPELSAIFADKDLVIVE